MSVGVKGGCLSVVELRKVGVWNPGILKPARQPMSTLGKQKSH